MKISFRLLFAAVVGLLALPGGAWAGPIWSVQWEFGTNILVSNSGHSYVNFTPAGTITSKVKDATALVAHVGVASYVPPPKTDPITHQNYGFLLKLTDLASHASRAFWFSGSLSGVIGQHTVSLKNTFNTPMSYGNIKLGNQIYSIHVGPFVTPTWSNHFNGTLSVYVDPVPNGMAMATPEPSALLLGGLGLALGGVPLWRRRRGTSPA